MDIEHCIFLSWFLASPEAMSKTARSCRASPRCGKQQRLAILPWRSNLALSQETILIGSCQIADRAYRCRLNQANASVASTARNAQDIMPCAE